MQNLSIYFYIFAQCLYYVNKYKGKCDFDTGDGIGGTEEYIGNTATDNQCADLVTAKKPTANGATWGNQKCYAEFGATGKNFARSWRTCLFEGSSNLGKYVY